MTEQLNAVTASRDELDAEIIERTKVERALQKSLNNLAERVKELNCLFEISRLVDKRKLSIEKILEGIVNLIPPALQYQIQCAPLRARTIILWAHLQPGTTSRHFPGRSRDPVPRAVGGLDAG